MDDMTCCHIRICSINISVLDATPQAAFFVRFVHFFKWMSVLWAATIYMFVRLLNKDKKQSPPPCPQLINHIDTITKAYGPESMMFLTGILLLVSIFSGAYLFCLYVLAEPNQDPERSCFVRFASVLFYDSGVVAVVVPIVTLSFPPHIMKTWINITVAVGAAVLVLFTVVDSCKVCAASDPPSSTASNPPSSTASNPPSTAAVHSNGPVGTHHEWYAEESICDYLSGAQPQGFDGISSCFGINAQV